jgi:flagellar biosynthesis/type III secretory pathway M-ring protein FliF/YscJ
MDFLKAQFTKLQQQFGQLTASQKMLSLALMAIMVLTLVLWGRYAGTAEMEPLLEQELASDEFSRITQQLRIRGIPYTPNGSRILVPADRHYEALAELGYEEALPKDTSSAFSEIVGKLDSPLNGPEKSAAIRNEAKQAYLAEILRNFPKVKRARVVIDNTQKRSFDAPVTPVCTVSITMKTDQKADNHLVLAAADLVTGAVAGLQRSHVKVIVDGVSRFFTSDDGSELVAGGSGSVIDRRREAESYFSKQITDLLRFCDGGDGVMVHVNVNLIDESSESHEEKYDPKGSVSKEVETETETNTTTSAANRPTANGDVGAVPNTSSNQGMSINGGGGGSDGASTSMEKTRSKMDNRFGKTMKITKTPGGAVAIMSASVGLPRSYFVRVYKSQTHTDKDPSEAVLAPFMKDELDHCRNLVRACLTLPTPEALVVDTYADIVPAAVEAPTQAASGVSMMLGGHVKEIALGALAVISLFMVSAMVRKSGPATAHASSRGGPIATVGGSPIEAVLSKVASLKESADEAAEVGSGNGALDGVELDGDAVRAQQVVEQVSTLVKENPDAAAQLVKRWLNRA